MTAAKGSRFQISYAIEDTLGSLPSSYSVYNLRASECSVNKQVESNQRRNVNSQLGPDAIVFGAETIQGSIKTELSYGAFDDLIAAALYNEWASDDTIEIGTAQQSVRLQKAFLDIAEYHEFSGCCMDTWNIDVQSNALVTSEFSVIGQNMYTAQTLFGASAKASNEPFDSFTGYIKEREAEADVSADTLSVVTGLSFSLNNSSEAIYYVGSSAPNNIIRGIPELTGTLSAYFATSTLLDRFLNQTEAELELQVQDPSGNAMSFYIPSLYYTGGDINVSGPNPIVMNLPFTAKVPTIYPQSMLQVSRGDYTVFLTSANKILRTASSHDYYVTEV